MGERTAHVLALEAPDEMGISAAAIAGTSMGAIIGAAYAAGIEGGAAVTPDLHPSGARVWGLRFGQGLDLLETLGWGDVAGGVVET